MRVRKQARALAQLGEPLDEEIVEVALATGALLDALEVQARDDAVLQGRMLKREFAFEMSEEKKSRNENKLAALVELLKERGYDVEKLRKMIAAGEPISPDKTPEKERVGFRSPQGQGPQDEERSLVHFDRAALDRAAGGSQGWYEVGSQQGDSKGAGAKDESPTMIDIMARQGLLLEKVLTMKNNPRSTIRVEPRVTWPKLGDDGTGGKEVQEFYEKLEEIFGLANNGQGMSATERLVALKNYLAEIGRAHV